MYRAIIIDDEKPGPHRCQQTRPLGRPFRSRSLRHGRQWERGDPHDARAHPHLALST